MLSAPSPLDIPERSTLADALADRLALISNALWGAAAHEILVLCVDEQARLLGMARAMQSASDEVRVLAGDLAAERRETARLRAQLRERPAGFWARVRSP